MEQEIENKIKRGRYSGPVPIAEINSAEKYLELVFPPSYREFLVRFGAAQLDDVEIAGIQWPKPDPSDCPEWTDIVEATLVYRPDSAPKSSIAIATDGGDLSYHLLCSTSDREYEGAVIEWGPGANSDITFATSFSEFCKNFGYLYNRT